MTDWELDLWPEEAAVAAPEAAPAPAPAALAALLTRRRLRHGDEPRLFTSFELLFMLLKSLL